MVQRLLALPLLAFVLGSALVVSPRAEAGLHLALSLY